jgi:hypothetical protein
MAFLLALKLSNARGCTTNHASDTPAMSNFEYCDEMLVSQMQHTALEQFEEHFICSPVYKVPTLADNQHDAPCAPKKTHISLFRSRNAINPVKLSLIF